MNYQKKPLRIQSHGVKSRPNNHIIEK